MAKSNTTIVEVDVKKLKTHPDNPRYIRDEKFAKLCESLRSFPDMLYKRPLIVNDRDEVLGGNMRLRAAEEIGMKKIPVIFVDWNEEKQREFIIKDNASFGQWDFDQLANEWNHEELIDWGLDIWKPEENLDDFFSDDNAPSDKAQSFKLTFEFDTAEQLETVEQAFRTRPGRKEEILIDLLK